MILLEILVGVLFGFVIGLIPNMHINTIAYLFLLIGVYSLYSNAFVFFVSFAITQTITSYVPTTVFGIPTSENIMHLFPLQRLAKEGFAKKGIYLCLVGSFFGGLIALGLLPILYLVFSILFDFNIFIYFSIFFVLVLFIFFEKSILKKFVVFAIIIVSGTLGIFTLKYNYFINEPLVVCIAGLFAIPFLIESIINEPCFVNQKEEQVMVSLKPTIIDLILSGMGALFLIIVPSFSSSQASLLISKIKQDLSAEKYLVIYSGVAICSIIFSFFLAIYFYKPRLGYISVLLTQNIISRNTNIFSYIIGVILALGLSIFLLLLTYKQIVEFISKLNIKYINVALLFFIITIIIIISGIEGIPILFLSIFIGYLPILFNVNKIILMSYIMVPTILFYI